MNPLRKLAVVVVLLSPMAANAIPILDQSSVIDINWASTSFCTATVESSAFGACEWQQQVTAGVTGQLVGLELALWGIGEFDISLFSSGTTFNTSTADVSTTFSISSYWTTEPVAYLNLSDLGFFVTAGESFLFEFTALSGQLALNGHSESYLGYDPYAGGTLGLRRGTTIWTDYYSFKDSGSGLTRSDLEFQTFVDPTTLPEPGTLALFAIGLAGMGLARRRRQSS